MTAAPHSFEALLGLPASIRRTFADVAAPATEAPHRVIAPAVARALKQHRPAEVDVAVAADPPILLDRRNERRPDLALIRAEGADFTPVLAADVLLVVEIVSPLSQFTDREDERKLYAAAGIPAYWVIDPVAERITLTELLLDDQGVYRQHLRTSERLTLSRPWPMILDLPAWTHRRDRARRPRRP
jgi:Uma2 family endonuclease